MIYPFKVPGFENRLLGVKLDRLMFKAELMIDGKIALVAGAKGRYALKRLDKTWADASIERGIFLDPLPTVMVDGVRYHLGASLLWYEWLWAALPVVGIFVAGIPGAVLGLIGIVVNIRLLRICQTSVAKFTLSGIVTLALLAVGFIISSL
jgi:hypothetical protein